MSTYGVTWPQYSTTLFEKSDVSEQLLWEMAFEWLSVVLFFMTIIASNHNNGCLDNTCGVIFSVYTLLTLGLCFVYHIIIYTKKIQNRFLVSHSLHWRECEMEKERNVAFVCCFCWLLERQTATRCREILDTQQRDANRKLINTIRFIMCIFNKNSLTSLSLIFRIST